jgi:peptidoglycan/xylan/chitin deacetylase (PgdA/CDA1 family)
MGVKGHMNKREILPHGIMFHHFHDSSKHIRGQGSISEHQFEKIIQHYGKNILSADNWFKRATSNSLKDKDICITFDDGLLSQYDIALPILEKYNLTAFWFVYSSPLTGKIGNLEVYRKFRIVCFSGIEDFYSKFFLKLKKTKHFDNIEKLLKEQYSHSSISKSYPFYSPNDTKFRFIRDTALEVEDYNKIIDSMMIELGIDKKELSSDLWMNMEHLNKLNDGGHIIGLHSHTHPTNMSLFSKLDQEKEYHKNYKIFYHALKTPPKSVSYPCGSYNDDSLSILRNLKIEIGFRDNMDNHFFSKLEFPREDHTNVLKRISS